MRTGLKYTALLTAAVCLLSLPGCGKDKKSSSAADSGFPETSIPEFTIPENILGEPSADIPDFEMDKYKVPDNEGMQLVQDMKIGWNLGNTFDATDNTKLEDMSPEAEMKYEEKWCGTVTTVENIAAIKAAGFQTIRIPVSWHNHVDSENHISEQWMRRVKEVVDWSRACDLYVILNVHHDNDENVYYPDSAHLEQSKTYLTAVWTQIADVFKDYDEHLILESMNEPRLVGTSAEWWLDKNNPDCVDSANCINELNQLFVDTVRNSGGNNATRWLMCPGYAASPDSVIYDGFKLPEDPANRIIVSVHAYRPYSFALDTKGTNEWSADNPSDTSQITTFMDQLYGKFVLNGIPVVIGEFGAMNKDNDADRTAFSVYYTAAARARGISCVWWDNNAFTSSGENFGLLLRATSTFPNPTVVQALMKGSEIR